MSFRDALADLADGAVEEVGDGETVWHIPMVRVPNGRPEPDPKRPAYKIAMAIFDKNGKDGNEPHEADLAKEFRGRHRPMVMSLTPTVTVRASDLKHTPLQGDEFLIVNDGDRYRVLHHVRAMQGMIRVQLEAVGPVEQR